MGRFWRNHAEAHPRSRGENAAISATVARQRGSSPLTRGKLAYRVKTFAQLRLIPAHAGKTRGEHGRCRAAQAHPRSRGENVSPSARRAVARGSSPLTRGKRRLTRSELAHARLIPAHAGKTPGTLLYWGNPAAHPRSRGENVAGGEREALGAGSSPLTRGKHIPPSRSVWGLGLIPAHAGKTAHMR